MGHINFDVRCTLFLEHKNADTLLQSKIAKFMGPTWDPPGSCRPQMGSMLAPWTLLSGVAGGNAEYLLTRLLSPPTRNCIVIWIPPKCSLCSLTHWGRVTHICVSKLTIIDSDNGLSPGRRQAIIWTNAGILSIRTPGTNFSEILSEIHIFSFKRIHLKMPSGRRRPFCLGLNVSIAY